MDLRLDRQLAVPDTQSALLAVPTAYLRRPWHAHGFNDDDEVRLTLRGIAAAEGHDDLALASDFLRWMADQERTRDVEDEHFLLTSAEFAVTKGVDAEPESPPATDDQPPSMGTEPGAEASSERPVDDNVLSDVGSSESAADEPDPGPEIAGARTRIARVRLIADLVHGF